MRGIVRERYSVTLVLARHILFNTCSVFPEATSLASLSGLIAASLRQEYGIDPAPIFDKAGLALDTRGAASSRYPLSTMRQLWAIARNATGDETIGLKTGWYARPGHFYAFGHSWLASATLLDAMKRLTRYSALVTTAMATVRLSETEDSFALSALFESGSNAAPKEGIDCGMTALLALCDTVSERKVRPLRVELTCPATVHPEAYREALGAPVRFNADIGVFHFDKDLLREPLPHGAADVARATDKIAGEYVDALDPQKVASQVRRLLIKLLPSGDVSNEMISGHLNRSKSTLRRQLKAEGLSYRDVLESTQRGLAENYLRENKHSHAQIAYLLGFSDQSNFSRAFKRWTSQTPKQFQDSTRPVSR